MSDLEHFKPSKTYKQLPAGIEQFQYVYGVNNNDFGTGTQNGSVTVPSGTKFVKIYLGDTNTVGNDDGTSYGEGLWLRITTDGSTPNSSSTNCILKYTGKFSNDNTSGSHDGNDRYIIVDMNGGTTLKIAYVNSSTMADSSDPARKLVIEFWGLA